MRPTGAIEERTRPYQSGEAESEERRRKFRVLPNGPGIELPARECTTFHRPAAGESPRVAHLAASGGRQLGAPAGRAAAGQLQCLVRRHPTVRS
jgi:hypothetical protein